ncbi:MAG: hypothetical protein L3K52_03840 [Candidatus Thiothrix sulfatifontis]|nr:MAG: hypothetical protein L3K52_03840 [Candidatus Thiothrix sulfatifontis]
MLKYLAHLSWVSACSLLLLLAGCDNAPENPAASPSSNVTVLETYIQALELENETLDTRFGKLQITHSQPDSPPDSLLLNDKKIFQQEGFYLSLHYYIKQNNRDVVLFGTNCGGTACPQNQFHFLLLEEDADPIMVSHPDFNAVPEDLTVNVDGERLLLDLGFQAGKHKNAVLQGSQLGIELETVPKSFVGEENCRWLYEEALGACKEHRETDGNCADPQASFPGYLTRGVAAVGEHPGFVGESFGRRCKIACESAKIVDYPTFAKEVCSKS